MHRLPRAASIVLTVLLLAACATPTPSAAPSSPPSSAAPSTPASASPPASPPASVPPSAEPIPSDELGEFTCELPIVDAATVPRANIVAVRAGSHEGYDRVVFEFEQGLPEFTLDRATPPFTQDATGEPIDVEGTSFLRLVMRGGTKQTEEGTSSYDGPTDFDPGFPTLVDLIEGGDFEAQSTWYLGLTSEACVRVIRLTEDGAPRLVIDVES
jgi:hypothetical protein